MLKMKEMINDLDKNYDKLFQKDSTTDKNNSEIKKQQKPMKVLFILLLFRLYT